MFDPERGNSLEAQSIYWNACILLDPKNHTNTPLHPQIIPSLWMLQLPLAIDLGPWILTVNLALLIVKRLCLGPVHYSTWAGTWTHECDFAWLPKPNHKKSHGHIFKLLFEISFSDSEPVNHCRPRTVIWRGYVARLPLHKPTGKRETDASRLAAQGLRRTTSRTVFFDVLRYNSKNAICNKHPGGIKGPGET